MPRHADAFHCTRCRKNHETLEARYAGDERLLAFYKRKLPKQGWAGQMDCTEREYALRVSPWRRARAERARAAFSAGWRKAQTAASESQGGEGKG